MLDLFLAQAPGQPQAPPLQPLPHPDLPELPPVPAEIATWVWIVGGVITLIMLVLVLWLLLNDRGAVTKFIYTGILGANMVLLIWSGSRTGMGMALVGFAGKWNTGSYWKYF
jgi:hypothetical protein